MTKEERMEREEKQGIQAIAQVLKLENETFDTIVDAIGVTETLKLGERCVYLKHALDLFETAGKMDAEFAILVQLEDKLGEVAQEKSELMAHMATLDATHDTEEIIRTAERMKKGNEIEKQLLQDLEKHIEAQEELERTLEMIMGVGQSDG